ncbi:CAP domain-containing protein, partial [Rhizobium leguminosarum]|uniref:CAP domain-containing protein n=1 Tax=Rhizobium leguminosarum TaxID=384 RepID=UPI003F97E9D9
DSFGARVKASGVRLPAAENNASGQQSVDAVVTAWINTPHHLENMLGRYGGLVVAFSHNTSTRNLPYSAMVLSSLGDSAC